MFIFSIRLEVGFEAKFIDKFQGYVLRIKLKFMVQGKCVWLRFL